jgi:hypothetical protein
VKGDAYEAHPRLLSVVALMVVMLATSVAPAFAGEKIWLCTDPTRQLPPVPEATTKDERDLRESQGYVCTKAKIKKPQPL